MSSSSVIWEAWLGREQAKIQTKAHDSVHAKGKDYMNEWLEPLSYIELLGRYVIMNLLRRKRSMRIIERWW